MYLAPCLLLLHFTISMNTGLFVFVLAPSWSIRPRPTFPSPSKVFPALLLLHFLLNSEGSVSARHSAPSQSPVSISHLSPPTLIIISFTLIIIFSTLIIIAFQRKHNWTDSAHWPSQETEFCGIHSGGQLTIKYGKMGGKL